MSTIQAGIVGLGRLGKRYASDLRWRVRGVSLVAACSLQAEELAWARSELGIAHTYLNYEALLNHQGLDAVFIVSSTSQHVPQLIAALRAGLHVFCEKPLGITLADCLQAEAVAARHPTQLAVVGFVRRFDPAYAYAKQQIAAGLIGRPFMLRSQTVDVDAVAGFQMEFVKSSGGIFHDMNVHDIDLARWFLQSEIQTVFAAGGAFKHPAFGEAGDADNVVATCVMENGHIAQFWASRTAAHGHDTQTEIIGTEGVLCVGRNAAAQRVEILDRYGVRQECVQTFYERFEQAFLLQTQDFIDCLLQGRRPALQLRDATRATQAAIALSASLFEGKGVVQTQPLNELEG
ncbi:MAG: oxidoreductase [Bacteroidetes bacterium]|nr:MAG: oxidoreductase [Bacteroidota bacterium]